MSAKCDYHGCYGREYVVSGERVEGGEVSETRIVHFGVEKPPLMSV